MAAPKAERDATLAATRGQAPALCPVREMKMKNPPKLSPARIP
jgi:hypothetical protein